MKSLSLVIILFSTLLFGVGVALGGYYGFYLLEYHEIPVDFKVESNVIGLNANADALHFGTVMPGGGSQRLMTVNPERDGRLVVRITGEAAPYVFVFPNDLPLQAGTPVLLNFTVALPSDVRMGNYSGVAKFYIFRD